MQLLCGFHVEHTINTQTTGRSSSARLPLPRNSPLVIQPDRPRHGFQVAIPSKQTPSRTQHAPPALTHLFLPPPPQPFLLVLERRHRRPQHSKSPPCAAQRASLSLHQVRTKHCRQVCGIISRQNSCHRQALPGISARVCTTRRAAPKRAKRCGVCAGILGVDKQPVQGTNVMGLK